MTTPMQIKTPEQFARALQLLLNNETTRKSTLDKLIQVAPTNPQVQLAHQYETNPDFRNWLNDHNWRALNETRLDTSEKPCQPESTQDSYEST